MPEMTEAEKVRHLPFVGAAFQELTAPESSVFAHPQTQAFVQAVHAQYQRGAPIDPSLPADLRETLEAQAWGEAFRAVLRDPAINWQATHAWSGIEAVARRAAELSVVSTGGRARPAP